MGYLIEIDDLSKRIIIIYPPRGMEFEAVSPEVAATEKNPVAARTEQKPRWQQVELGFGFTESATRLTAVPE